LVHPVEVGVPVPNRAFPIAMSALWLIEPVFDAVTTGKARQLTFPQGQVNGPFQETFVALQNDFQPVFSPDGKKIAYIRNHDVLRFPVTFATPTIRIVDLDGSNDHEVLRFEPGNYISTLAWSPDGTQLVFDAGLQASENGLPVNLPVIETMGIYRVNTDGSGFLRIHEAPAAFPTWSPSRSGTGSASAQATQLSLQRGPNTGFQLIISKGRLGDRVTLESSDDLKVWRPITTLQKLQETVPFDDTESAGRRARFYRAVSVGP